MKFRRAGRGTLQARKISANAVFKAADGIPKRVLRRPRLALQPGTAGRQECCSQWIRDRRKKRRGEEEKFLVAAVVTPTEDGTEASLVPTLITPWSQSKASA